MMQDQVLVRVRATFFLFVTFVFLLFMIKYEKLDALLVMPNL